MNAVTRGLGSIGRLNLFRKRACDAEPPTTHAGPTVAAAAESSTAHTRATATAAAVSANDRHSSGRSKRTRNAIKRVAARLWRRL